MSRLKESTLRVRCKHNTMFVQAWFPFPYKYARTAALTVGREYPAVAELCNFRVINDKGDVRSYPDYMFEVVNRTSKEDGDE